MVNPVFYFRRSIIFRPILKCSDDGLFHSELLNLRALFTLAEYKMMGKVHEFSNSEHNFQILLCIYDCDLEENTQFYFTC
jgi:hypothetical protein